MTNYGFCGPMTDMDTVFANKEIAIVASGGGINLFFFKVGCMAWMCLTLLKRFA